MEWYIKSKANAFDTTKSSLYVSPSTTMTDVFSNDISANPTAPRSIMAMPIIQGSGNTDATDPQNGFVGETMVVFSEQRIVDALGQDTTPLPEGTFRAVVRAGEDAQQDQVVVGLGNKTVDTQPSVLTDVLLPNDGCNNGVSSTPAGCENVRAFEGIINSMQEGQRDSSTFLRSLGRYTHEVSVTYAPVSVPVFRPIDSSDMTRGVTQQTTTLYSLAFGQGNDAASERFEEIEDNLSLTLQQFIVVLLVITLTSLLALIPALAWITHTITAPVAQLTLIVTRINGNDNVSEFPKMVEGSSEIYRVRKTFERLFKILRFATVALFMGQLQTAYDTMHEALMMFTRIDNQKAIGIASNNLGCLMLTLFRAMQRTGQTKTIGFSKRKIVLKGYGYFKTSIDLGEKAMEDIVASEGTGTLNHLVFMQQLSNRYFNRGLYLLTIRKDHPNPHRAYDQGMIDMMTCKDMDREVVDNGDHEGFKGDMDLYFELLLSRIKGVLQLMRLGYDDPWGIEELFDEAKTALVDALKNPDHPLFDDLDRAGQMQRLDTELIEYHSILAGHDDQDKTTHIEKAAEIAIRMLVEDDYLLADAAAVALQALIDMSELSNGQQQNGGDDPEEGVGQEEQDDDTEIEQGKGEETNESSVRPAPEEPNQDDVSSRALSTLQKYHQAVTEVIGLSHGKKDAEGREWVRAANLADFSLEAF